MRSYEVSLLKLITKVTDGTRTEVDRNSISLTPGRLTGGEFSFQCDSSMPLTYFLEPLVLLFPLSSQPTTVTLTHSTANTIDNDTSDTVNTGLSGCYSSLECFSSVCTIILQMIGSEVIFKYKEPYEMYFRCGPVKKIEPIILWKSPKIKRIRGTVVVRNLQPSLGKNAIIGAKRILDQVCDNTWIALNTPPGKFKPTLLISLIAEGTKNCIFTSNTLSHPLDINDKVESGDTTDSVDTNESVKRKSMSGSLLKILNLAKNNTNKTTNSHPTDPGNPSGNGTAAPVVTTKTVEVVEKDAEGRHCGIIGECERLGEQCAFRLCSEIALDSVIDTTHQHLLLYFMALSGDYQVSQIRLSKLNRYSVQLLRFVRRYLGIIFKFEEVETESGTNILLVKCVGSNYHNINLKSF